MKAQEQTLRSFLDEGVQFVAPSFQNAYRWGREAWDAVLESLLKAQHGEHFLGAMVAMPLGNSPPDLSKYLLIDGQHRLVTVMMLVAALRDHMLSFAEARAREMTRACLLNASQEGAHRFKLLPTRRDRAPFEAILLGEKFAGSRPIAQAYQYFLESLAHSDAAALESAYQHLVTRFMIVSITLEPNEDPYPIFKSLSSPEHPFTPTGLAAYYRFSSDPELMALVAGGESQEVEFKETAFRNQPDERDNGRGSLHVVRSVAGFLNSSGGWLLIGVRDDGSIRGVNPDYILADRGRPNWDGYQLHLANMLRMRLGIAGAVTLFDIERRVVEGRDVALIRVRPAPAPVYVDKRLYVRAGTQTLDMQGPDLVRYVGTHWEHLLPTS